MLLEFCLFFLTYALLDVYVGEGDIKASALYLDGKMVRFLMVLCCHGIPAMVPGSLPQTLFDAPLSYSKESCGLFGFKITHWSQKVLLPPQHPAASMHGQSCQSSTCLSPKITIPHSTVATFADITLHLVTKVFKCGLRQMKRWPNFCKVQSMERFPKRDNKHF